jgi:hypothetical protein
VVVLWLGSEYKSSQLIQASRLVVSFADVRILRQDKGYNKTCTIGMKKRIER